MTDRLEIMNEERSKRLSDEIADAVLERLQQVEKVEDIQPGTVVQIADSSESMYAWCFMLVTDIHEDWVEGDVFIPRSPTSRPQLERYRAKWTEVEYIGDAVWFPEDV